MRAWGSRAASRGWPRRRRRGAARLEPTRRRAEAAEGDGVASCVVEGCGASAASRGGRQWRRVTLLAAEGRGEVGAGATPRGDHRGRRGWSRRRRRGEEPTRRRAETAEGASAGSPSGGEVARSRPRVVGHREAVHGGCEVGRVWWTARLRVVGRREPL